MLVTHDPFRSCGAFDHPDLQSPLFRSMQSDGQGGKGEFLS